jgi:hypothetical protein
MQVLRITSFMHEPSLLGIQAVILIGPYLTGNGRFVDAWTLFGTTIRLAQAIGLHRDPRCLNPNPPIKSERSVRQTMWWWMLHLDEHYSFILSRPLGISGIGDCAPPQGLTINTHTLRLCDVAIRFTILARQVLSQANRCREPKLCY